jgi:hypothetical protein
MKNIILTILLLITTTLFSQDKDKKSLLEEMNNYYNKSKIEKLEELTNDLLSGKYGNMDDELKFYALMYSSNVYTRDEYVKKDPQIGYDKTIELINFTKITSYEVPNRVAYLKSMNTFLAEFVKKHPKINKDSAQSNTQSTLSSATNTENKAPTSDNKTVTLTVSGTGKTIEEARLNALRSAIEQAFGAFISSKTEILNDNVVKDEIVSISNGNIQKYDVISQVEIPNNGFAITLNAIVSISKLTSFVESKGVVSEFKGNLFAFNVKNQILNEKNEEKAIFELVQIIKQLYDSSLEYKIMTRQPISVDNENINWKIRSDISVSFNNNIFSLSDYLINTLNSVNMTSSEVENYKSLNKKCFPISIASTKNKFSYINLRSISSYNLILEMISYFDNSLCNFKISNGLDIKETLVEKQKSFFTNTTRFETLDDKGKIQLQSYGEKVISEYKKDDYWYYNGISRVMILTNNENFYYTEGFIPKSFDSRRYGSEGPFKENNNNNLYFTDNMNFNFLLKLINKMENKVVKVNYDNGINFEDINFKIYKPGLVISFIVFEQKVNYDFHFNDIKTLDEINKITEYKIIKK